jgi:hypothetical protein
MCLRFFPYFIQRSLFVGFVPSLCRANTIVFIFDRQASAFLCLESFGFVCNLGTGAPFFLVFRL